LIDTPQAISTIRSWHAPSNNNSRLYNTTGDNAVNLEQLADLAEILGVIAVVITLIYLSVQVRQGTQILWSESRQAQVAYDQGGVYKFVEYPELGRLFSQTETPTAEEKTRLMFWMIGQMRAREHEWLQYRAGALDEETWSSYRGVIFFLLGTNRAKELWGLCSPFFNQDFVVMVSKMIEGVPEIDFWEKLEHVS
jgi:hypothetical protein